MSQLEFLNSEVEVGKGSSAEIGQGDFQNEESAEQLPALLKELEQSRLLMALEGLLLSSDRPLPMASIRMAFEDYDVNSERLLSAIEELKNRYREQGSGLDLVTVAGGYQFRSHPDVAEFILKSQKIKPFRLTPATLEVLAIVAYKQPIVKAEIDEIRGVDSGHLLRVLMDKKLVGFKGKSELPGKPMLYGTTKSFLEVFGLDTLESLPTLREIEELLPPEALEAVTETTELSEITDALSESLEGGSYSEGEEELERIAESLSEIQTQTAFFEEEKSLHKAQLILKKKREGEEIHAPSLRFMQDWAQSNPLHTVALEWNDLVAATVAESQKLGAQIEQDESNFAKDGSQEDVMETDAAATTAAVDERPSSLDLTEVLDALRRFEKST